MVLIGICKQKCVDFVVEELKWLIMQCNFKFGDKFLQEIKLQEIFGVSKGMICEVFKFLEVQGLVSVSMGLVGGGIIVEVLLDCMFQFMQNYLFFKDIGIVDVYIVCWLFELELVVGVVLYLMDGDFCVFEYIIDLCDLVFVKVVVLFDQCQEDLSFYDILVVVNFNLMLWFCCELINEMIWQFVVFGNEMLLKDYVKFGVFNVKFYWQILDVVCVCDVEIVCEFMSMYMEDCMYYVMCMKGWVYGCFVFDFEMLCCYCFVFDEYDDGGYED